MSTAVSTTTRKHTRDVTNCGSPRDVLPRTFFRCLAGSETRRQLRQRDSADGASTPGRRRIYDESAGRNVGKLLSCEKNTVLIGASSARAVNHRLAEQATRSRRYPAAARQRSVFLWRLARLIKRGSQPPKTLCVGTLSLSLSAPLAEGQGLPRLGLLASAQTAPTPSKFNVRPDARSFANQPRKRAVLVRSHVAGFSDRVRSPRLQFHLC